jgi:hypothetical protein
VPELRPRDPSTDIAAASDGLVGGLVARSVHSLEEVDEYASTIADNGPLACPGIVPDGGGLAEQPTRVAVDRRNEDDVKLRCGHGRTPRESSVTAGSPPDRGPRGR